MRLLTWPQILCGHGGEALVLSAIEWAMGEEGELGNEEVSAVKKRVVSLADSRRVR
jgi:hypothetical protein